MLAGAAALRIYRFPPCSGLCYLLVKMFRSRSPSTGPNARSLHERPVPRTGGVAVLLGAAAGAGFGALSGCRGASRSPCSPCCRSSMTARRADAGAPCGAPRAAGIFRLVPPQPIHPLELVAAGARGGVDHQPLQLHGRQRRPCRRHDARSASPPTASRRGSPAMPRLPRSASRSPRAAAGSCVCNLPPARMFLGDVGAVPLGFLAAALGIGGLARRRLAARGSRSWCSSVRRRCDRHAGAPAGARRALLGGATRALLPAAGPHRRGPRGTLVGLRALMAGVRGAALVGRAASRPACRPRLRAAGRAAGRRSLFAGSTWLAALRRAP